MNINEILEAIDGALATVQNLTSVPGVNAIPYVGTVSSAVSLIRAGYAAGKNVMPLVDRLRSTFDGDKPTQDEIDALDAEIAQMEADVDAPLPPAEPGEK